MNSTMNAHASSRRSQSTVRGAAWNRFLDLGRDDGGAVFVVTLALFFLMYLVCCGVYAISTAVRERIQLQNACDAAAYSAAVVQADTISRIATINRAMAWTYVQMTRRQMDYIVLKWLTHTVDHYKEDMNRAIKFNRSGSPCALHQLPKSGWFIGSKPNMNFLQILLNQKTNESIFALETATVSDGSLGFGIFSRSIRLDKSAISDMNVAEQRLAESLRSKIDAVVRNVVNADVPERMQGSCQYFVRQCENPLAGKGYFSQLQNTVEDERHFLSFADFTGSFVDVFKAGIDQWFVRGNGTRRTHGEVGIQRCYKHWAERPTGTHLRRPKAAPSCRNELCLGEGQRFSIALVSDWAWWAIRWVCRPEFDAHLPYAFVRECEHGHDDRCRFHGVTGYGRCYADEAELYDSYYIGAQALPLVLRENYFGKDGTITVGIVRKNQNVWERILGAVDGIFCAFDPDWTGDVNTSKTFVFASAKAGYVDKTSDRVADAQRIDYRIDWQTGNQKWNLCQGNWDAVFVPVRMSNSLAVDGKWQDADDRVLEDLIGRASWRSLDGKQSSGIGSWREISAPRLMNGVDSERMYVDGFSAEQRLVELRYATDGGKSKNLNWEGLSRVLYH